MFKKWIGPAAAVLLSACSTTNHHSHILFIPTARLIDGIHDRVIENADIVVINGRIAALGENLKIPANAKIVDLKKFTVLPTPLEPVKIRPGQNPMSAIQAATAAAAKAQNLEKKTGSISEGLSANMIAVEGDPLSELGVLRNVKAEIKEGLLLDTVP